MISEFEPKFNLEEQRPEENPEKSLEEESEETPTFDAVVLFGGGIRDIEDQFPSFSKEEIDNFLTTLPDKENKEKILWSKQSRIVPTLQTKMRALGCLEILKKSEVDEIIVTGGKVNPERPSEAELMRDYIFTKYQQELQREVERGEMEKEDAEKTLKEMLNKIKLEDKATNTIENFANIINMMDEGDKKYDNIAYLSNEFHTSRISQLGEKFNLKGDEITAEEGLSQRSSHYQSFLDKATDPNNPIYQDILKNENKWKRGLAEVPLYFLPQAVGVNQERLEEIYEDQKKLINQTLEAIGLTWEEFLELPEEERLKLREQPPEEWAE